MQRVDKLGADVQTCLVRYADIINVGRRVTWRAVSSVVLSLSSDLIWVGTLAEYYSLEGQ